MAYLGVDVPAAGAQEAAPQAQRPVPNIHDPLTAPFWEAAARDQLTVRQCTSCKAYSHPPVFGACIECQASDFEFVPVSGRGRIYSYATIWDQRNPAFDAMLPFSVVSVELTDVPGVIFQTNLPETPIDKVEFDAPVDVFFQEIAPGIKIPQWRVVAEEEK